MAVLAFIYKAAVKATAALDFAVVADAKTTGGIAAALADTKKPQVFLSFNIIQALGGNGWVNRKVLQLIVYYITTFVVVLPLAAAANAQNVIAIFTLCCHQNIK